MTASPVLLLRAQTLRDPQLDGAIFELTARLICKGSDLDSPQPSARWHTSRNLSSEEPQKAFSEMRQVSQLEPMTYPSYLLDVILLGLSRLPRALGETLLDRLVERLDLEGHQVLALAYEWGTSSYLRLVVCRIHPKTRQASRLPTTSWLKKLTPALSDLLADDPQP